MDRVDHQRLLVQDLINLEKAGGIELQPWYQRRAVWKSSQQAYLINTIFSGKPIPSLYIRHKIDPTSEKSVQEVVDGQQRVTSIIDFRKGKFSVRVGDTRKRLKYADLHVDDRRKFLETSLSVGYLIGASDADVIDIFGRINSVAKTLNAQEKRNADFSGEFKQYCLEKSSSLIGFWRANALFSETDVSRMKEVEFFSDLVMNFVEGLSDFSASKLSNYYEENDEKFDQWNRAEAIVESVFSRLGDLPKGKISSTAFSRSPLFFSLCFVMHDTQKLKGRLLIELIEHVQTRMTVDVDGRPKTELDFLEALRASTQRIASRRARDRYLRSLL